MDNINKQASEAMNELLSAAVMLKKGDIVVVGCSTSEVGGRLIGTNSSSDIAHEIMEAFISPSLTGDYILRSNAANI